MSWLDRPFRRRKRSCAPQQRRFHLKVRMAKRVISVPVLAALGVAPDGQKRLLSLRLAVSEASTHFIITTTASPELADIHHRQPAIIGSDRFDEWLDPTSPMPRLLDLVREPYGGPYEKRAISTRVNSVRNDDPDMLAPRSEMELF